MGKTFFKTQKFAVLIGIAFIIATSLFFQNCAKSLDLSQYSNSASSTTSCTVPSPATWTAGSATCMSTTTAFPLNNGAQISLIADAPSTGAATFDCISGTLSVAAGATCVPSSNPSPTPSGTPTPTPSATPTPTPSATATKPPPTTPPTITTQPVGHAGGCIGDEYELRVVATDANLTTYPLTYQWYENSTPITGATTSTLVVTLLNTVHSYYVAVSNAGGTTDSMTVTVVAVPTKICFE